MQFSEADRMTLGKELELDTSVFMERWEHDVANFQRIHDFLEAYTKVERSEGERYLLMRIILQSIEDALQNATHVSEEVFTQVESFVRLDKQIHQETIDYWCVWEEGADPDPDYVFAITPWARRMSQRA